MIFDELRLADRYFALHPGLARGLAAARSAELARYDLGRHEIDGERLLVIVAEDTGRGRSAARLEAHRKYIDIQLALEGNDEIGWKPTTACRQLAEAYDPARDIEFFADPPEMWLSLGVGQFAVFFPDDSHAPLAGTGPVRKAVFKVSLHWP
jgi:biofilm protein TabA